MLSRKKGKARALPLSTFPPLRTARESFEEVGDIYLEEVSNFEETPGA
jgi:hypothetical protein